MITTTNDNTRSFNNKGVPRVNPQGFTPKSRIENAAISLETTLENMKTYKEHLWNRRDALRTQGKDVSWLDRKIFEVAVGIREVDQKCCTIWNDIGNS